MLATTFVPLFLLAQVIADRFALVSGTSRKMKNEEPVNPLTDEALVDRF